MERPFKIINWALVFEHIAHCTLNLTIERKAMYGKSTFMTESDKDRWNVVSTLQITSSVQSDVDEDGRDVIKTHTLPWLSSSVQHFKQKLDDAFLRDKSPQAKR